MIQKRIYICERCCSIHASPGSADQCQFDCEYDGIKKKDVLDMYKELDFSLETFKEMMNVKYHTD